MIHFCGLEMSKNPHPDAGMPNKTLDVGCVYVCIPCTIRSRHEWCQRAYAAERELTALRAERDALRVDAERYQFLKSHSRHDLFDLGVDLEWHEPTEGLDDAIDAALDRIDNLEKNK